MIGIVMLNYNNWQLSIDCIHNIRHHIDTEYNIYLVDNHSSEKMPDVMYRLIKDGKDLVFLKSEINRGYAAGNNIGIQRAIADGCSEILITNNDVIYNDSSISNMKHYLSNNVDVGIVGPKIYLPNGELQEINMVSKMTVAGKYFYLLRKTPFRELSKNFVNRFHGKGTDKNSPFIVYAVSGCCFMVSERAFKYVFPLDEGTFLYEEENIIGARMEKSGLKTVYCTDSVITHIGGGSTNGFSEFAYNCFMESEKYYLKEYCHASIFQYLPLYFLRKLYGYYKYK